MQNQDRSRRTAYPTLIHATGVPIWVKTPSVEGAVGEFHPLRRRERLSFLIGVKLLDLQEKWPVLGPLAHFLTWQVLHLPFVAKEAPPA